SHTLPTGCPASPTRRSSDLAFPRARFRSTPLGTPCAALTIRDRGSRQRSHPVARYSVSFVLDCHCSCCRSLSALAATLTACPVRSEEHTSELQSRENLVCRL